MRGERIAALGMTALLVLSFVGGGFAPAAVGTVSAQSADTEECSTWDSLLYDMFTIGNTNTDGENPCSAEYQRQQLADEWNESDAKQTRTQIHSQAGQLAAGNEQYLTVQSNTLTESNTIAFSKGEAAAVEVLANGGTIAEAQTAANESIEDYYTTKQRNLVDRWNVNAETVATLSQRAENTTGVSSDFVTLGSESDFGDTSESGDYNSVTSVDGIVESTVQLVNGSTVTYSAVGYDLENTDAHNYGYLGINEAVRTSKATGFDIRYDGQKTGDDTITVNISSVKVRPTENLSSREAFDMVEVVHSFNEVSQKSTETKQEVSVYVEQSLGPAVQSGELNATSYISPATLAQEYAQEYGNDTSYIRATAIAAYSGMDAPSLNETGSMTVTHDGTTYEGLLLSQEAPAGGWEKGQQYDPALLSGFQFFATAGENATVVELDGPFTVDSIKNGEGDPISTATTYNITYETANTSEDYAALQQQIRELNQEIEEQQAQATSGGSTTEESSTNWLDQLAAALGVSAGAAVAVIAVVLGIAAKVYSP